MTCDDLLRHRLYNQRVTGRRLKNAEDVVRHLGAVQSQEYTGAKWAIGERTSGITDATLDELFDAGRILRTHVMRPTWHFVLPADIRWMLQLTAPRVNSVCRSRYRELKLDDRVFERSYAVLARALRGGKTRTRAELGTTLREAGVLSPRDDRQRLTFVMLRAELDGVVCSGPRSAKQPTYALLDERVPWSKPLERSEARAELARRYFMSHGPATVKDFMWWSGLAAADARAGVEAIASALARDNIDGRTFWRPKRQVAPSGGQPRASLLTTWDECFVAYRDRSPADMAPGRQLIVIDGRTTGTWKRAIAKKTAVIDARPFSVFGRSAKDAVAAAAERYGRFLGMPVTVSFRR